MPSTHAHPDSPDRINNFDLIRIVAALQVMVFHGHEWLGTRGRNAILDTAIRWLGYIPGVPIFFTVSGFLIAWSFDRTPNVRTFTRNRFLRIYPALWATLALTTGLLIGQHFITQANVLSKQMVAWFLGQLTIFMFYTPPNLRHYGLGNPNGSLWTIPVEIQFYCVIPFVVLAFKRSRRLGNAFALFAFVLSVAANVLVAHLNEQRIVVKLLHVTVVPYLFYFLFGTLAYANWNRLGFLFRGKVVVWMGAFALYSIVFSGLIHAYEPTYWPNPFGLVAALLLAGLTLSAAFTRGTVASRVLHGNDCSYGLYLLHGVVLNVLVQQQWVGTFSAELALPAFSIVLAILSWRLVEEPALRRKRMVAHSGRALT